MQSFRGIIVDASSVSLFDKFVGVDVVTIESCHIVLDVPNEPFAARPLSKFRVVNERDGCALPGEPGDTRILQIGLLNVAKFSVNGLQKFDEICLTGRLVKFLVTRRVNGSVLFRIELRVELRYILLGQITLLVDVPHEEQRMHVAQSIVAR